MSKTPRRRSLVIDGGEFGERGSPAETPAEAEDIGEVIAELDGEIARLKKRNTTLVARLGDIRALVETAINGAIATEREAALLAIRNAAEFRHRGGRASGAARLNKLWHRHASEIAAAYPRLTRHVLTGKIDKFLIENNIKGRPVNPKTIDRFLKNHLKR
jgi:hypothetical protein